MSTPSIAGCLVHHLLDKWDQLAQGSALGAYDQELSSEERGGVGLPAVSTDLQGLSRQLFCEVGISGDLCPLGKVECIRPAQNGLIELLRQEHHDLDTAIHLVDVPGQKDSRRSCVRRKKQQHRVGQALGPNQGVGGPGQGLLE